MTFNIESRSASDRWIVSFKISYFWILKLAAYWGGFRASFMNFSGLFIFYMWKIFDTVRITLITLRLLNLYLRFIIFLNATIDKLSNQWCSSTLKNDPHIFVFNCNLCVRTLHVSFSLKGTKSKLLYDGNNEKYVYQTLKKYVN